MSILRPQWEQIEVSDETMKRFPPFVQDAVADIIADWHKFDDEDEGKEGDELLFARFLGCLPKHPVNGLKEVQFWIASHDENYLWMYLPGSNVWIRPDSHYIFFKKIKKELLPEHSDYSTWWVISQERVSLWHMWLTQVYEPGYVQHSQVERGKEMEQTALQYQKAMTHDDIAHCSYGKPYRHNCGCPYR